MDREPGAEGPPDAVAAQAAALAAVLGAPVAPYAVGGESRTFRLAGTTDTAGPGELVTVPFGWPAAAEPEPELRRRVALQQRVAQRVRLPVPEVVRVLPEHGLVVVRELSGTRLVDRPLVDQAAARDVVAAALGSLLADLHTWAPEEYAGLAVVDDGVPEEWRAEGLELAERLAPVLGPDRTRDAERFLARAAPPPTTDARFSHHDLGIEHVLVTPTPHGPAVTGVIDWDDAAVADPAHDFGLILRDLGPRALEVALASYAAGGGRVAGIAERAVFYAGCTLLEDLAFGLARGRPEYVVKSEAAWEWVFRRGT